MLSEAKDLNVGPMLNVDPGESASISQEAASHPAPARERLSAPHFRYAILPEERLILTRFEGPVCIEELLASTAIVCGDDRYAHGFDGFIDLTGVRVTVSIDDVKQLVDFTMSKRKHGNGKWAVLVTSPAATAFAMLYQRAVAERHPFSIFSSLEGASHFLERGITRHSLEKALRAQ